MNIIYFLENYPKDCRTFLNDQSKQYDKVREVSLHL